MKKLYILVACVLTTFTAGAQCVINQSVFSGPTDYRILPDTMTGLPIAIVGVNYSTDLQFHVQPDTTTTLGTFPFIEIHIDSITGIPPNFSPNTNPTNGIFPGGSYGCAGLTGVAVAGQELGGPTSNGIYPIIIYYTAIVDVFNIPTEFPSTKTGYKVQIQAANNVPSTAAINFSVNQNVPNPSDRSTEFLFTNTTNGSVQFRLYNILGETVKTSTISAVKGDNRFSLSTAELPAGVYFYEFRSGTSIVTRRMTVSH